ncbi:MAG: QueT transporter family protein [Lachnospiraceae bacterium]|nr:QueT transporter family protein [Lachnospiraceae bacterium]
MKKTGFTARAVALGGVIAALYVALSMAAAALGLSSGVIQVRFSEALCILPCFTPAAIPGVTVGCFLTNVIAGGEPLDMIFGTVATLIGAVGTFLLRKNRWLAAVPPILANVLIIPWVLQTAYGVTDSYWFLMLTIFAGEFISIGILGELLYTAVDKSGLAARMRV